MRAIVYLMRKEIKNTFLDMFHHPAKLFFYLAVIVLLGFSLLSGTKHEVRGSGEYMDFRILHGIYLAIMLFIAVVSILTGVKSGATFFKMSDVNFLFVSPISPQKILAYGLVKQMASSMIMMIFLMFYSGMAVNGFGVTVGQMVALVAGIALMVFMIQMITLLVYSFTSGRPKRVMLVKFCTFAITGGMVAFALGSFLLNGADNEAIFAAIASPYLEFVPVVGWIKGMIFGIISGNGFGTTLYATLNIFVIMGSIGLFVNSKSDYYEDVLQTTENAFELKSAIKSGRSINTGKMNINPQKVRDTGINHGWGANTFFFKHLREAKRRSLIPYIKVSSFVLLLINVVLVIVIQKITDSNGEVIPIGHLMGIALAASSYVLFFLNAAGDWSLELGKTYIYLVPEKPLFKLIWASMTSLMRPVIDGAIVFTVLCILLRANPATALICMLIYTSMGFLYTASNVLFQRVFGLLANKGLILIIYMLLLGILLVPGVGGSLMLYSFASQLPGIVLGLPLFVCNVLISVGIFAACRNILSTIELNQ